MKDSHSMTYFQQLIITSPISGRDDRIGLVCLSVWVWAPLQQYRAMLCATDLCCTFYGEPPLVSLHTCVFLSGQKAFGQKEHGLRYGGDASMLGHFHLDLARVAAYKSRSFCLFLSLDLTPNAFNFCLISASERDSMFSLP